MGGGGGLRGRGERTDGILTHFNLAGTGEERLQQIMTRAKETGMSVSKIFGFFTNHPQHITKDEFKMGLQRLGAKLFDLTDEELQIIIDKFDVDGDGTISIAEFKVRRGEERSAR